MTQKPFKSIYNRKDVSQPTMNSSVGVYRATDEQDIRVRKYGEAVYNTLSSVASVLEYPKGKIFCRILDYIIMQTLLI